jgi:hypothetical protein
MEIDVKFRQPQKIPSPNEVTEFGIITFAKLEQLTNAHASMLVTVDGIVTEVNPVEDAKAYVPIVVTE